MSRLKTRRLTITTDAGGDATVNDTLSILGKLFAVEWVQGTLAATSDVTLTVQGGESGVAQTLLTLTNQAANALFYPRHLVHGETGTALTGTAGGDREMPAINGTLRVVVAQGGATAAGSIVISYEPGR